MGKVWFYFKALEGILMKAHTEMNSYSDQTLQLFTLNSTFLWVIFIYSIIKYKLQGVTKQRRREAQAVPGLHFSSLYLSFQLSFYTLLKAVRKLIADSLLLWNFKPTPT